MFRPSLIRIISGCILAAITLASNAQGPQGQRVDHRIRVRLDDEANVLHGKESVRYINRSKTQLQCIYFHLWPEAYSEHNTALSQQMREQGNLSLYYASEEERGRMDSLSFKAKGKKVPFFRSDDHQDVGHVLLNDPLDPGDTVEIDVSFRVTIPDAKFSRMGAEEDAFKITQWYPKPAVYDKNGWNLMPYLQQGEFYNEFGSYDVKITLPANYSVGATGKLVGSGKERKRLAHISRKTTEMDSFPEETSFPESAKKMKTLHYRADSVTDFAWFADKRYRVLEKKVPLPRSDRTVLARVFFTDHQADLWEHSMKYLEEALYYYSLWVGPYPHDRISVVSSRSGVGGGMEYPGVTVIGPVNSGLMLERVIAHEVGHNWFQATLANNERKHPWMDEGLNSYYENRYMETVHPDLSPFEGILPEPLINYMGIEEKDPMYQHYLQYKLIAAQEGDQPLSLHSTSFTQSNYGVMVYSKGALLFDYLEQYLGRETIDRAVRDYYDENRFTHPAPSDLKRAFTSQTDKDLSPFFEDFLNTTGKIDIKLKKAGKSGQFRYGDKYQVTLKNQGDIAAPFPLTVVQSDTMVEERWVEGLNGERTIQLPYHTGQVKAFSVDGKGKIPEMDRRNDRYSNRSFLFPRQGGLSFKPFIGLDEPPKNDVYFFPSLGWNSHDGLMTGIGLHEQGILAEPFDMALAPMYGWKSERMTGLASLGWNAWWDESKILDHFRFGLNARRFSYDDFRGNKRTYERVSPSIELWYEKADPRSPNRHKTIFQVPAIHSEQMRGSKKDATFLEESELFYSLEQLWERSDAVIPMEAALKALHHETFTRISGRLETSFRYNDDLDDITLRIFGGHFLRNGHSDPVYNWQMDGRGPGQDFLFGNNFFARGKHNGALSQQFIRSEGGFYTPTAYGSSNKWIASVGFDLEIPFPDRPALELFFNQGWGPSIFSDGSEYLYEAGVSLSIVEDIAELHFPLLFSSKIQDEHKINGIKPAERIRFELRLDRLDLFERLRTHSL